MTKPAALALIALAATTLAARAQDAGAGFAIKPPAPFVAERADNRNFDIGYGINPTTGQPPIAGTGKYLCQAGFKAAPQNAGLKQAEINAQTKTPERAKTIRDIFGMLFEIDALRVAAIGDVKGFEIEARPKMGPGAADARIFGAIHETPKGRVTLMCSTTKEAWVNALPAFRALRASITPPK